MIVECAKKYQTMLNKKCIIDIAKGKEKNRIVIEFDKNNFFHLSGLHKLYDLDTLFRNRKKNSIFNQIVKEKEIVSKIKNSGHYKDIETRIRILNDIERILSEKTKLYKSPYNANTFTSVKSDYLAQFKYFTKTSYLSFLNTGPYYVINSILYDDSRKLVLNHNNYRIVSNQIMEK